MKEQIHKELTKLQQELNKLDTAARHIGNASKISEEVVISAKGIHHKFAEQLEKVDGLVKTLLTSRTAELEKVVVELSGFLDGVKETSVKLEREHKQVLENIKKDSLTLVKSELKRFEEVADIIKSENEKSLKSFELTNEELATYTSRVEALTHNLVKVDFPTRLEKLDATTAGINQTVQNLQYRIEKLDSSLKEHFNDQSKQHEAHIQELLERFAILESKSKTNTLLIVISILVAVGAIVVPFLV